MLKHAESLKSKQDPSLSVLQTVFGSVAGVQILEERVVEEAFIDAEVLIELPDGTKWLILLEYLARPEPRNLHRITSTLTGEFEERARSANADHAYLVVTGPWFSDEAIGICRDHGVGFADEQGNCLLTFGTVHIEVRGRPNPKKRKVSRLDISKPKSARVVRTLLCHPHREWKVVDLASACEVSVGTVSRVRTRLLDREWAEEGTQGFVLKKPDALLDAWTEEDDWAKRTEVREYSLLDSDPVRIAEAVRDGFSQRQSFCVFTQWFAGWLRAPYTIPPVVSAYVPSFPEDDGLREFLRARRVDQGSGNLRLIESSDLRGLLLVGSQSVRDFSLVSDAQIYLDLKGQGLRADDQAEELRKSKDFLGAWK